VPFPRKNAERSLHPKPLERARLRPLAGAKSLEKPLHLQQGQRLPTWIKSPNNTFRILLRFNFVELPAQIEDICARVGIEPDGEHSIIETGATAIWVA
jgi:hypothetical protein